MSAARLTTLSPLESERRHKATLDPLQDSDIRTGRPTRLDCKTPAENLSASQSRAPVGLGIEGLAGSAEDKLARGQPPRS